MKVFVRDHGSGLFLKTPSAWVESLFEATDFGEVERANQHARELQKPNLEVFLTGDDRVPIGGIRVDGERR